MVMLSSDHRLSEQNPSHAILPEQMKGTLSLWIQVKKTTFWTCRWSLLSSILYLCRMQLEEKVMQALKEAMKQKDQASLRSLRAIKSAILLFKTSGTGETLDEAAEIKLLQKMVKQRKESAAIFHEQNRNDLAVTEEEEIAILETFLPKPLSEEELKQMVSEIIQQTGASSMKDMGKVMGLANQQAAGRAEGKVISDMVKQLLTA